MSLRFSIILMVFLSGSLDAQVPGFFMKKDSRRVVVPFSQVNNLIIIPVSINGGPPLNFLFDTGVKSNILFSKSIGSQLEMTYARKLNIVGADGPQFCTV